MNSTTKALVTIDEWAASFSDERGELYDGTIKVRLEPFDDFELDISTVFGDEPSFPPEPV